MSYSGWNLMDDIIVVLNRHKQGFVVDSNNKKQLETALRWAGEDSKQVELKNEGFTVEILRAASGSSQGGKLSFWTCKITKDDLTFEVGIDANMLLACIRSSTIVNGVIQEKVVFARNYGLGLLHKDMKQYEVALNDMKTKDKLKKKTSKHIIGRNYMTINENDVYVGDSYNWWNCKKEITYGYRRGCGSNMTTLNYSSKDKPTKIKMVVPKNVLIKILKGANNLKSYIDNLINEADSMSYYSFTCAFPDITKEKLPSRAEGELRIIDDTTPEDWERLFNKMRELTLKKYNNNEPSKRVSKNYVDCNDIKYWITAPNNKEASVIDNEVEELFGNGSNAYNKIVKIIR